MEYTTMRDMTVVLLRAFLLTVSVVGLVIARDFPQRHDPNTPRLPPHGVLSQAGYGAPCKIIPCQPGMSCCHNAQETLVCEDVNECTSQSLNKCTQKCINSYGNYTCGCDRQGFSLHQDGVTCQLTNLDALADCEGVDHLCECERNGGDEICSVTFQNTVCNERGACVCDDESSLNSTTGDCIKEPCPIRYVLNPVSSTCLRLNEAEEKLNWTTASARCAVENETLAVFPTHEEAEWLHGYTTDSAYFQNNDHADNWYRRLFWIGLIESNGWKWIARSNKTVSRTDPIWDGYPTNTGPVNCALYTSHGHANAGPWYCDRTLSYYMCERISA